nr:nitrous oxide reductase family maturation protein NosD [Saprospiraceae bacterium]
MINQINLTIPLTTSGKGYIHCFLWVFLMAVFIPFDLVGQKPKVLEVREGEQIKKAIEKAQPGDTIVVYPGIYREHEIIVQKSLTLIGIDFPVVDSEENGDIFLIAANSTTVTGFELINTGHSNLNDHSAIKVFDSNHLRVENNRILNSFFGIHISNSKNITIRDCFLEAYELSSQRTGNGIHLWKSDTALIANNFIAGHRDGIYLEFATEVETSHNIVEKNNRYGLHFMFSHDNSYYHNEFRNNDAGVAVMYTRNVVMEYNLFEDNLGSGSYGVLLKDISNSTIRYNRIVNNSIGIYMDGSNNNTFEHNLFRRNGYAIKLLASNDGNYLGKNNFIGNTFDISTSGMIITNELHKNYWDKYEGYDLDRDGYGDVPFRPINMYSTIVERIPSAIILWRSFMITLLDRAERVIPAITPENMKDEKPKMRPHDIDFKLE